MTVELVRLQFGDPFFTRLRARLDEREQHPLQLNDAGCLVHRVENLPRLVIPHSLQSRVLHISNYPKIAGHSKRRTVYLTLHKNIYWAAVAVE